MIPMNWINLWFQTNRNWWFSPEFGCHGTVVFIHIFSLPIFKTPKNLNHLTGARWTLHGPCCGKNSRLRKGNTPTIHPDALERWSNLTGEKAAIWTISWLHLTWFLEYPKWFLRLPPKMISWWTQSQLHWMPGPAPPQPPPGRVVWRKKIIQDTLKWWDFSWQISWNPICGSLIQPDEFWVKGMRSQVKYCNFRMVQRLKRRCQFNSLTLKQLYYQDYI